MEKNWIDFEGSAILTAIRTAIKNLRRYNLSNEIKQFKSKSSPSLSVMEGRGAFCVA
jgi:hypothetical protein